MWKQLVLTFLEIRNCEDGIKFTSCSFERGFYKDKKVPLKDRFMLLAQDMNLIPRQAEETLRRDEQIWRNSYEGVAFSSGSFS